jgi:hypothetical protein
MTTRRMYSGAVGGLLVLLLGFTAAPVASASQKPAAARGLAAHAAPAAAAAADLGARAPTRYKYKWSSIAWAGSRAVIAATDAHGDLFYFWLAAGKWHGQEVAKGKRGVSYSTPAIGWTGNAVAIAAINAKGNLVYFAQHSGSSKWSYRLVASSPGKFRSPSITSFPEHGVLISVASTAGQLLTFELAPGQSNWTRQLAGYGTFGASSVVTCYDSLAHEYLALITSTSGGSLYFWWEALDAPLWHQETIASPGQGGIFTGGGSIAATAHNLLVAVSTTTGWVDFWTQPIGGTGWNEQVVAANPGSTYSHPEIAWTGLLGGQSYDVITATNQHGELDYWWTQDGVYVWTHEKVAGSGKQAVYANPGLTVSNTSVLITAVNTKPGDVWYWHQAFDTNPWLYQRVARG